MEEISHIIKVCHGGTCTKNFAYDIKKKLEKAIEKAERSNLKVEECRCMGLCQQAPNMAIFEQATGRFKIKTDLNPAKVVEQINYLLEPPTK